MCGEQGERRINHKQIDAAEIENLRKEKASYGLGTLWVLTILRQSLPEDKSHTGTVFGAVSGKS